jgi:CDP-glycerol glycerophosphotransferase
MRIVYQSFEGRYTDSPRAIYEAAVARGGDHEHIWLSDPAHTAGFPDGVANLPFRSDEGVAALEAADLVVANTHTDIDWRKKDGATYLQTWHGTPLKRIHWDVLWAPEGRLDRLQRDVDQWDLLISPNAASTPRLRGAFHYEGEVLEVGYPRNDVLVGQQAQEVRRRVRAELGLAEGTTAVLYAPTWRDDDVFGSDGGAVALPLDPAAFAGRFGADHTLLLRLHYMMTGRLGDLGEHDAVRDVSWHPEVADLYLAADMLVTDYSSVMFDYAVTGKPQLFFTYDLEDYGDRVRGFYFDFAPVAPGPLVRTQDELFGAIADLDAVTAAHAERYAAFRETFCHLEDGAATERVLARLGL